MTKKQKLSRAEKLLKALYKVYFLAHHLDMSAHIAEESGWTAEVKRLANSQRIMRQLHRLISELLREEGEKVSLLPLEKSRFVTVKDS